MPGWRPVSHTPEAVLFDIDGTLVDTVYLHTYAWWRALDEAGHVVPMARIHPLIGMGSDGLLSSLLGHPDDDISEVHGRHFTALHPFIRPLPGAGDLLRRTHGGGSKVVLVTSAKEHDLPALLGPLDSDDQIDDIVHGEMVEDAKPSPEVFETALDRLSLGPDTVVAVGDAVWDVKAAMTAGIPSIGVETGGTGGERLLEAGARSVYCDCAGIVERWADAPLGT